MNVEIEGSPKFTDYWYGGVYENENYERFPFTIYNSDGGVGTIHWDKGVPEGENINDLINIEQEILKKSTEQ